MGKVGGILTVHKAGTEEIICAKGETRAVYTADYTNHFVPLHCNNKAVYTTASVTFGWAGQ